MRRNKQVSLHCFQHGAKEDLKCAYFNLIFCIYSLFPHISARKIIIIKSSSSLIVIWHFSRLCGGSLSVVHLKSASDCFLSIHHFVAWPQDINKQLSWIQVMANQSAFTAQSH